MTTSALAALDDVDVPWGSVIGGVVVVADARAVLRVVVVACSLVVNNTVDDAPVVVADGDVGAPYGFALVEVVARRGQVVTLGLIAVVAHRCRMVAWGHMSLEGHMVNG